MHEPHILQIPFLVHGEGIVEKLLDVCAQPLGALCSASPWTSLVPSP